MKRPSSDALRQAAMWLDLNEGDGTEVDSCSLVAAWLRDQADSADLRDECRAFGVPVAAARKAMTRLGKDGGR